MNANLLFLDADNLSSKIAEHFARRFAPNGISISGAGINNELSFPLEYSVYCDKTGIDGKRTFFREIASKQFDLVITIGPEIHKKCPVLPGVPALIHWDIKEPGAWNSWEFNDFEEELKSHLKNLFNRDTFITLIRQRVYLENVLESLQEGIIAHDLERRIFLFNNKAEEITGVSRDSVLGKDCHDLFKPHFCGERCIFTDNIPDSFRTRKCSYTTILNTNELRKEIEVTRVPLKDENGKITGALATLTDVTRVKELETRLGEIESFSGIIGRDHKMEAVFQLIRDLAVGDFPVIISGESGTGKELVAAAIHNESTRRDHRFVPVNCGAIPEGTLESELFGHVKGAFTGAIRDKKGRFELADKGTLFLDEIGELSVKMQVKLLRVLQEGSFEPVGSEISRKVDVRIICATNRNLREMIAKGTFREDLYYRLAVVPVELPPLRERRTDIPLLADHFLNKTATKLTRTNIRFSQQSLSILISYNWPGNVRQLQNAIQFALVKCKDDEIRPEHLPPEISGDFIIPPVIPSVQGKSGRKPKLTINVVEQALVKSGGNKAKAARILNVGRATLYNFLSAHERPESVE